ncbi:hypothetical protein [Streptomyces sp. 769]|uniref:hypothetical protein n=1 Tax=Streptomyces sp. 769 TaxID=1262452 RepID=UPI00057C62A4|nr:hypothetical protein [Streptomyces sp. 769]AJC53995.1 hypothetical protein GZL_01395 [Streptomyces sp. 769]
MRRDPASFLIAYLSSLDEFRGVFIGPDLVGRKTGLPAIILDHAGGVRMVRDRMDRADFSINVYGPDRETAASLAYACREYLLEDFPGRSVSGVQVLDVSEVWAPRAFPDSTSREFRFLGNIAVFFIET